MAKYSYEYKLKIVVEYLNGKVVISFFVEISTKRLNYTLNIIIK
jgi:hypothetical protein